jgi:hypothetical protein
MSKFDRVLEMADTLNDGERENLIAILQARQRDERRAEIINDVKSARGEFRRGECQPATPDEIAKVITK